MKLSNIVTSVGNTGSAVTRDALLKRAARTKREVNRSNKDRRDRALLDREYTRLLANIAECPAEHLDRAEAYVVAFGERFCSVSGEG